MNTGSDVKLCALWRNRWGETAVIHKHTQGGSVLQRLVGDHRPTPCLQPTVQLSGINQQFLRTDRNPPGVLPSSSLPPSVFRSRLMWDCNVRWRDEPNMTELRKRCGGGGNPDSTDNISDKVTDPHRGHGGRFRRQPPAPRNKFLRLLPVAVAGLLCSFSTRANELVSCCNPATTSTQTTVYVGWQQPQVPTPGSLCRHVGEHFWHFSHVRQYIFVRFKCP